MGVSSGGTRDVHHAAKSYCTGISHDGFPASATGNVLPLRHTACEIVAVQLRGENRTLMVTEAVACEQAEVKTETVLPKPPEMRWKRLRPLQPLLVIIVAFAPLLCS